MGSLYVFHVPVRRLRLPLWLCRLNDPLLLVLLTTLALTRMSITQVRRGNTAVWHLALSRYHPDERTRDSVQEASSFYRGSSIFGFDKMNGHQKSPSMTSRDWFAPAEPTIRLSDNVDGQRDNTAGSSFGTGRAGPGAYGNGAQSAVPLQQQFQTPSATRGPAVTQTIDGFEIISPAYYFQNQGNWNQGGPQSRT